MGIGISTVPGEFFNLTASIMVVAIAWVTMRQLFAGEHGPPSAFLARINRWWVTYSERARGAISVGAAILTIGVLTLAAEIIGSGDTGGGADFIAFIAIGAGTAQLLYGMSRGRSPGEEG